MPEPRVVNTPASAETPARDPASSEIQRLQAEVSEVELEIEELARSNLEALGWALDPEHAHRLWMQDAPTRRGAAQGSPGGSLEQALSRCHRWRRSRHLRQRAQRHQLRRQILDATPPARVYVFRDRFPRMHRDGWQGNKASSRIAFAWFVWDRNHTGQTSSPASLLAPTGSRR